PGTLVPSTLVDGTLELLPDAPRPVKTRTRVRFHVGTSEIMARALLLDRAELAPGDTAFARFRLEAPLLERPGDRIVARSYSPLLYAPPTLSPASAAWSSPGGRPSTARPRSSPGCRARRFAAGPEPPTSVSSAFSSRRSTPRRPSRPTATRCGWPPTRCACRPS